MSPTVLKRGSDMVLSNTGFVPFVVADDGLTMNATPAATNTTATRRAEKTFTSTLLPESTIRYLTVVNHTSCDRCKRYFCNW